MKPDSDLQNHVMQALAADPHVDETALGVAVRHGVVTLFGIVQSADQRDVAEAVARRVSGVHDVANEIEVKLGENHPSDPEIAEAVRNALATCPHLHQEQIATTVAARGHVTLRGTVATAREREAAGAALIGVDGVEIVTNAIAVQVPATTAAELRSSIEQALARHLTRDLERIAVEVHGDTVVLTGTIGSAAEQRAVIGVVKGTPGIRHVEDRLHVAAASPPRMH